MVKRPIYLQKYNHNLFSEINTISIIHAHNMDRIKSNLCNISLGSIFQNIILENKAIHIKHKKNVKLYFVHKNNFVK